MDHGPAVEVVGVIVLDPTVRLLRVVAGVGWVVGFGKPLCGPPECLHSSRRGCSGGKDIHGGHACCFGSRHPQSFIGAQFCCISIVIRKR